MLCPHRGTQRLYCCLLLCFFLPICQRTFFRVLSIKSHVLSIPARRPSLITCNL
jgi:hypothetical protein